MKQIFSHNTYAQMLITVCFLVMGMAAHAGAVTLPFSDNFTGDRVQPASVWSWTDQDGHWGTRGTLDHNTLYIRSQGIDVWTNNDQYAAYYLDNVDGDFTASVQIIYQQNSDDWAKCGIMVKNNITASGSGSGYVICALTPSHGYTFQKDTNANGYLDANTDLASPASSPNTWVRVSKSGTTFTAYYSTDGTNWLTFATATISAATTVQDVGLFVCSHDGWESSAVKFDNFSITGLATNYTYYRDLDGDGYGDNLNSTTSVSATPPAGYTLDNTDCNDNAATAHPGGTEVCDGLDNDCNGSVDEGVGDTTYYFDSDGDGYGTNTNTQLGCALPSSDWSLAGGDCNDNDAAINPSVFDICGDDIDQDCSGTDRSCDSGNICMDIADVPLATLVKSAPPMIMFLLDDSGSMAWDVLCPENNGQFDGASWVYDRRTRWKAQYYDYNGLYYNPASDYDPWPNYPDSDSDDPRKHPVTDDATNFDSSTRDLDSTFTTLDGFTINYAHWYMWSASESAPYLVLLKNGAALYYKVINYTSGDHGEVRDLSYDSTPPADVVIPRSYADERQNFANWYTYYRTRELVAKAALGKVINEVSSVKVGIYAINEGLKQEVLPIAVEGETDNRQSTLTNLYHVRKTGWTPLRSGLQAVGDYYKNDKFASADDGGACQQAFTIVMTDGYYNGDPPTVGNADGNGDTDYDSGIYSDSYSNTLADVAMYYYEYDMSGLDDIVSGSELDDASHQHMVTYTVSFGLSGTLTPNDTCPETDASCPTWVNPEDGDDEKIDDLWHTAVNGRGRFLSAADTEELIYALSDLVLNIQDRSRTGAAVSVNSQRLENDTDLYQVFFESSDWSGDIKAYDVLENGTIATDHSWSAQERFEGTNWESRKIFTFNGSNAVNFTYENLTDDQRSLLNPDETIARDLIDYIRGDSSDEVKNGGSFRNRSTMLGDIVDSPPEYDNGIVYVGANDGMLHAFKAVGDENDTNGTERFAFIPSRIIENLRYYADVDYSHKFFVDGPITTTSISGSMTLRYLVGGLGKGGRGVYGMDITNAAALNTSSLPNVWEYPLPNETDDDMGFTFSSISIVSGNNNQTLVIFGNGYDSPNGHSVLYILSLNGELLKKIDTGAGDNVTQCNGLSTPVPIDLNYDGKVDYVYAGDLLGNMWKFDLTSNSKDDWGVFFKDSTSDPMPLFQAKDKNGDTQPITGAPDVMYHCDESRGGLIVVFGTGKFISLGDNADTQVQSIYGIWDWSLVWDSLEETSPDKYMGAVQPPVNGVRTLSNLAVSDFFPSDKVLSLLEQVKIYEPDGSRYTSEHPISWFNPADYKKQKDEGSPNAYAGGLHVGWFMDLPEERERVIADTQIREGTAIMVSIIPSDTPCSAGGSSYIQLIDVCDGSPDGTDGADGDGHIEDEKIEDILQEPAILGDKMYFDKETTGNLETEVSGLHYWRMFE